MVKRLQFVAALLGLCILAVGLQAKPIRRAFFDIGSGTTRMIIADVDPRTSEVKIVHEESQAVDYKLDLEVNKSENFSQEIMDKGVLALARMKWLALEKQSRQFSGAATSAFRTAKNGAQFAQFITQVLGIKVAVISQEDEARLGFLAAVQGERTDIQDIVVWDLGGGSMQMVTADKKGKYSYYFGDIASVSFSTYIIEKIQGKSLQQTASPNPIGKEDLPKAIKYAQSQARLVPDAVREKLKNPKTVVIGIGGVHYYSIRNQVKMKGEEYTFEQVKDTTLIRTGKTDEEITGEYAKTEVSNLILVMGYMEELKIKTIKTKNINNAHGMLLSTEFWK